MPISPLEDALYPARNSTSPFEYFKGHNGRHSIWRTRSLDEVVMSAQYETDENHEEITSAVTALHASFDAALLDNHSVHDDSIFRVVKRGKGIHASAPSWDEDELSEDLGDLSGRKHLLNAVAEGPDVLPPGTVRKLPRRCSIPPRVESGKTPGRQSRMRTTGSVIKNSLGSMSPISAAGRRRAPPHQRKSPLHQRQSPRPQRRSPRKVQASNKVPPMSTLRKPQDSNFRTHSPATPRTSLFAGASKLKTPLELTPTRATPSLQQTIMKSSRSHACHTGTTVNTSLDATVDTESPGPSSPNSTPFRFTSFPASLPRVNPRTIEREYNSPFDLRRGAASTRKRMSFSTFAVGEDGDGDVNGVPKPSIQPLHLMQSHSKDDDVTHNSSLSSLSGDGGHHQNIAAAAPLLPPTLLEWKSPRGGMSRSAIETKYSTDSDGAGRRLGLTPSVHTKLFMDEDHDGYGYSDDESMDIPSGRQVAGTRLNFNLVVNSEADDGMRILQGEEESAIEHNSNEKQETQQETLPVGQEKSELCGPYEQYRINSFSSSVSTNTPLRNISGCDEGTIASTSAVTPSRPGIGSGPLFARIEQELPKTPDDVHFHFHLDASQCSPIPGIPEEEEVDQGMAKASPVSRSDACAMEIEGESFVPNTSHTRPPLQPLSSPRKRSQRNKLTMKDTVMAIANEVEEASKLSLSQESGDSGSTTSSKNRRLRPLPDMSAFDAGIAERSASSSRVEKSADESSGSVENRAPPSSPKLVCPPTPVRTPAWAHNDNGAHPIFTRANSLIATKVLATCPLQVIDGHSSLENSLMEDDDSEPEPLGRLRWSFAAVDEEAEEIEDEHPINDLSEFDEILATNISRSQQPRLARHSSAPLSNIAPPPFLVASTSCCPRVPGGEIFPMVGGGKRMPAPPKLVTRMSSGFGEVGSVISFSTDFDNLGRLGSGAFADVYKVRSRADRQLYAVKRNRRQFRGKRDREMAMSEVRTMQRLQSVCVQTNGSTRSQERAKNSYSLYLLFFFRAWQEEGYFFCQTELCCRDTCREMMSSLKSDWSSAKKKYPSLLRNLPPCSVAPWDDDENNGRLVPESTIWKICHDVAAGLSHIHAHGVVHHDIKPSNIFLVSHPRLGAMCKIGDFGMAGIVGSSEDGQEGDTIYMAPELLSSSAKHTSADIFSLGLSLYELAASPTWELPSEGRRWHDIRSDTHKPDLPVSRSTALLQLIQAMIRPEPNRRPSAEDILNRIEEVKEAGNRCDTFLKDYIKDIEEYDRVQEEKLALAQLEADERGQTPRNGQSAKSLSYELRTPTNGMPFAPFNFTPSDAQLT